MKLLELMFLELEHVGKSYTIKLKGEFIASECSPIMVGRMKLINYTAN